VFENRVLRRIFEPKRDEVALGWRICIMRSSLYVLPIIMVIKSRRMTYAGYVARMREMRNDVNFRSGNLKGRDNSEDLSVYGNIILKWILRGRGWEGVNWMHLTQCRTLMNTVTNLLLMKQIVFI
jgi:hypothetical protein